MSREAGQFGEDYIGSRIAVPNCKVSLKKSRTGFLLEQESHSARPSCLRYSAFECYNSAFQQGKDNCESDQVSGNGALGNPGGGHYCR